MTYKFFSKFKIVTDKIKQIRKYKISKNLIFFIFILEKFKIYIKKIVFIYKFLAKRIKKKYFYSLFVTYICVLIILKV